MSIEIVEIERLALERLMLERDALAARLAAQNTLTDVLQMQVEHLTKALETRTKQVLRTTH